MKEKTIIMQGIVDEDGYELDNRVYFRGGCIPTERAGNSRIKVVRKYERSKEDRICESRK